MAISEREGQGKTGAPKTMALCDARPAAKHHKSKYTTIAKLFLYVSSLIKVISN